MKLEQIAVIDGAQDGAVWGNELFRFDSDGVCKVYDITSLKGEVKPKASFTLSGVIPHSNSVCFGAEKYSAEDEYPILYSNIYNNYHKDPVDKLMGTVMAYRLKRDGGTYSAEAVGAIKIGFCEDARLWKASEYEHGKRPYGNFVIDREKNELYAFVMRNEELGTRYFKFAMPRVGEGSFDERLGVSCVVLSEGDIISSFDCSYHYFLQGACFYGGRIYSTEGFGGRDTKNRPAIRIVDPIKREERYYDLVEAGANVEPELIDFYDGRCIYSDSHGNVYQIDFEA